MPENNQEYRKLAKSMLTLAMVNVVIWGISIIALIFVINRMPGAKGMFPILGGGVAVGVALLSTIQRFKQMH